MTSPKSLINHKWNFRCICHVIFFSVTLYSMEIVTKIPAYFSKSCECWSRRLETGCVFEAMPFSSEAPVAGCSFVSQSIHPALHLHHHSSPATQQEEEEDINTVCVCMCMNVTAFVSKRSISVHVVCELFLCLSLLHAEECVCVCVCDCARLHEPSSPLWCSPPPPSSLSAICPSWKHQLVPEGPLGEKQMTGRSHFFYPHKDVPLLPVSCFFQEVFVWFFFPPFCIFRFYLSISCLSVLLPLLSANWH